MNRLRNISKICCFVIIALSACQASKATNSRTLPVYTLSPLPQVYPTSSNTLTSTSARYPELQLQTTAAVTSTQRSEFGIETTPTPLVPTPPISSSLTLISWSSKEADHLINILQYYPETLTNRGYHGTYAYFFNYAILAQKEAIFRFPNSILATKWRWDRAYNMAQYGEPGVEETYSELIREGLERGETDLSNLPGWFGKHEARLDLSVKPLVPSAGVSLSTLAQISNGMAGFYVWITGNQGNINVFPLVTDGYRGFPFEAGVEYNLEDLTRDGLKEIIITQSYQPGGQEWYSVTAVFDLKEQPPRRLIFDPPGAYSHSGQWLILRNGEKVKGLRFENFWDRISCPGFAIREDFHWTGQKFEFIGETVPSEDEISLINGPSNYEACWDNYFLASLYYAKYDPRTLAWSEMEIENFPRATAGIPFPMTTPVPYSSNIKEQARFQLALNFAFTGQVERARRQMVFITSKQPPDDEYSNNARIFLEKYHQESDLISACSSMKICLNFLELEDLFQFVPLERFGDIDQVVKDIGLEVETKGLFDFDGDSQMETWLIEKEEDIHNLWVINKTNTGLQALFIAWAETIDNFHLSSPEPIEGKMIFKVKSGDQTFSGFFDRNRSTGKVDVIWLEDWLMTSIEKDLTKFEGDFFSGGEAYHLLQKLLLMENRVKMYQALKTDSCEICIRWKYLLALAYELTGQNLLSKQSYYEIWRDYPDSPFSIMAKAKLSLGR